MALVGLEDYLWHTYVLFRSFQGHSKTDRKRLVDMEYIEGWLLIYSGYENISGETTKYVKKISPENVHGKQFTDVEIKFVSCYQILQCDDARETFMGS